MNTKITLLDYGMCNLLNVARAFEYCGAEVLITEDRAVAKNANKLIVPGVGAFADSMEEITSRGFDDVIRRFVDTDRPFLGICVGMQMLFDSSEEFGYSEGLGILAGSVKSIPARCSNGELQRIPHIGWNKLTYPVGKKSPWKNTILCCIDGKDPAVYFVHSFSASPVDETVRLADVIYGGHRLCSAVQKNNLMATQFHPERSGEIGLDIIRQFISL